MNAQPISRLRPRRRALGLVRVSMEKDGGTSPGIQRHAIQSWADANDVDVVAWVEGVDERKYSGSREDSLWWPKLDDSIDRMESGDVDLILVWKFSRTARNRLKWAIALDRVDSTDGELIAVTEPVEAATASGKLFRGMTGEFNAYYADLMSESWKDTHMRRRRAGLTAEGGPRYGYIKQPDGTYLPQPEEAQLLAQMYRRYLAGDGFTKIVAWLNRSGHLTRNDRPWSRVTVTHLLDSGFGAGLLIHRKVGKGGKRDWRIATATYHPGAHPAVITEAEWTEYRGRRLQAPEPSRVVAGKYMLTGLIFCGDCGAPMHVGNQGLKDYKCSRAAQQRDVPGMYMTRALVEQRVREWVSELAADVDELASVAAAHRARTVVQLDNVQTLDKKIADIKQQLGRLAVRWSAQKMSDAAYDAATAQLDADLETYEQRRRAATPRQRVEVDPTKILIELDQRWEDATVDERRRLLRTIVRRVEIVKPVRQGTGVWRERVVITPTWAPIG
ncbi:recombinase family protein [Microbacterium jejuense]|nr:recombinase family protein [Microbacterium jejuense]